MEEAQKLLGNPYRLGPSGALAGKGPYYFDCSGFVAYVYYKSLNLDLPTSPAGQKRIGELVTALKTEEDLEALEVGDILFFEYSLRGGVDHTEPCRVWFRFCF